MLTGPARQQYLARALASLKPDPEDELKQLGFLGASELAKSRATLRGHVDAIHSQQITPPQAGAAPALAGASRVADYMPRAEPIGPGRTNPRADKAAADEAILRAYLAGNSLRVIATAAGLSHESVRTIAERMQEWARQEADLLAQGVVHVRSRDPFGRDDAHHARRSEHLRKLLDVKNLDS